MGLLLKIAIFAVAGYVVWSSARRMLGLGGGQRPAVPPTDAAPPPPTPQGAPRSTPAVEDARQCRVCGAYVAVGAAKCGRSDCPLGT